MDDSGISFSKIKNIAFAVLLVLVAIICVMAGWKFNSFFNRDTAEISSDSIREEIVPVAKLVTYEYNFTQILYFSDANMFLGFEVPGTKNAYIATIDGVAYIGFNADLVTCDVAMGLNGELSKIVVSMPHSALFDVAIDHDTLKKYEERSGLFNSVTPDDYNNLLKGAEAEQKRKVTEGGLLDRSDKRAEQLIEERIKSVYGDGVEVKFKYIQEDAKNEG